MSSKNNVIQLADYRKRRQLETPEEVLENFPLSDISEMRQEIIEEDKRNVKRTILSEFIALHVILPNKGLSKCGLYDISEDGLAFEMEPEDGAFKKGEKVALRVYLNQKTYFPFVVTVNHVRFEKEEGVYRHGCSFVKNTINAKALHHFSQFIEHISAFLKTDYGDVMVSNLGK